MIKRLLQIGLILSGFASMPCWAILIVDVTPGSLIDGADVGSVDLFMAEADKAGNPADETIWVNSILLGIGTGVTVQYEVKTEDVMYFSTDTSDVFAFELVDDSDYFLVKNSTRMALFENLADIDWGVFDTNFLSDAMNIPGDDYTISHVTQFNSTAVPEPGMVGLLAIGLLGMVATRRRMKV